MRALISTLKLLKIALAKRTTSSRALRQTSITQNGQITRNLTGTIHLTDQMDVASTCIEKRLTPGSHQSSKQPYLKWRATGCTFTCYYSVSGTCMKHKKRIDINKVRKWIWRFCRNLSKQKMVLGILWRNLASVMKKGTSNSKYNSVRANKSSCSSHWKTT